MLKHYNLYRHSLLPKLAVFLRGPESSTDTDRAMDKLKENLTAGTANKQQDFASYKNIEGIAEGIQGKLADSAKVISAKEHADFAKTFERLSGKQDVKAEDLLNLDRKIEEVTTKSLEFRDAIKSTLKEVSDTSDPDLEKQLASFDQLDLKGKEAFVKNTEEKIAKLQGFLDKLKGGKVKISPKGIEATLEELDEKNKLFTEYSDKLHKNQELIGNDDVVSEFQLWMCQLPTVAEQKKALQGLDKIFAERKPLVDEFKKLSPETQKRYPEFMEIGKSEKEKMKAQIEIDLNKDYHSKLNDSKVLCEDTKAMLRSEYDKPKRTLDSREGFIKMLETQIKTESSLQSKFESLPTGTKAQLDHNFADNYQNIIKPGLQAKGFKDMHKSEPKFWDQLNQTEKEIMLDYVDQNRDKFEANNEKNEKLQQGYDAKLKEAVTPQIFSENGKAHPVLSEHTAEKFSKWFAKELQDDKSPDKSKAQSYIDNFTNSSEYAKRITQIKAFDNILKTKQITPEAQDALCKQFDAPEASFSIRQNILDGLTGNKPEVIEQLAKNATAVDQLKLKAAFEEAQGKFANAQKLYEAVLLLNPEDEGAKKELQRLQKLMPGAAKPNEAVSDISPEDDMLIDESINAAMKNSSVDDAITKNAILQQMADMYLEADRRHKSNKRTNRFQGEDIGKKKEVDERLQDYTNDEQALDKAGKAKEVTTLNVNTLKQAANDNPLLRESKKTLSRSRTNEQKLKTEDYIGVETNENGRLTGQMAKNQAERMENDTRTTMEKVVLQLMADRKGGQLSPKLINTIQERVRKTNIKRTFQDIYN